MDDASSSSDHRRSMSENTSHSWETEEDGSLSRLNVGSSEELQNLMEDREIASRAVAFVVNSTRKGFVPLCANVASLMKSKRRLEKKVARLKREVEVLRSLNPSGGSKRLTPTSLDSLSSDKDVFLDPVHLHVFNELLKENYQCSSSCSQSSSSSQVSNSPKPAKKQSRAAPAAPETAGPQVVTVHLHHTSDGTQCQKPTDTGDEITPHAHLSAPKPRKKLLKASNAVVSVQQPQGGEVQPATTAIKARNQPGLSSPDGGKACGSSSHGVPEVHRVNGFCESDDANRMLSNELAASRSEIERLTMRLKQYESGINHTNGSKLTNEDDVRAKLSSCTCQLPIATSVPETVFHGISDERSASNQRKSSPVKDAGSVAVRHSKVHNTANQDSKDGSSVSSEDTRGIASTDFESVASSVKESMWHESRVESKKPLSKLSSSCQNQARPLHRSKALNKQNSQSKFNYIHSLEPSKQSDRYLV